MARGRKNDKRPKRVTAKRVQVSEDRPYVPPEIEVKAELDEAPWDAEGLTPNRLTFVNFYVGEAGGDATKAAELAGYGTDNRRSLRATASRLLNDPFVSRAIASRLASKFAALDPQELRSALARIGQSDLRNFYSIDDDGTPRLDFLKARDAAALGQLKELRIEGIAEPDGTSKTAIHPVKVQIKVHNPQPAIELLSKMAGMLIERHEHGGTIKHDVSVDLKQLAEDELRNLRDIRLKLADKSVTPN